MEDYIGKICPFCKTEITETDTVKVCPACDIAHHEDCWNENHGCTTFGCSGDRQATEAEAPASFCSQCGIPLSVEDRFCPNCGTACVAVESKTCPKCAMALQADQLFCPNCGQPADLPADSGVFSAIDQFNERIEQQKKKKKLLPVILGIVGAVLVAIVLVVLLLGGPKVEYITLDQSDVTLRTGENITVECEISPESASDVEIIWSTDNASVATVEDGVITAKREGSCTVTAKAGGKTASVQVEVYALKDAERAAVGHYNTIGYFDENDNIEYLTASFGSLTLRSDLTGKIEVGDTELEFTWWLYDSENGDHFYLTEYESGEEGDFFMSDGVILFGVNMYTLVFE